jgi:hypothetical protein
LIGRRDHIGRIELIELETGVKRVGFALHRGRTHVTGQSPGILIFQPPPEMDSYNAFFDYPTSLGVERFSVFSPE